MPTHTDLPIRPPDFFTSENSFSIWSHSLTMLYDLAIISTYFMKNVTAYLFPVILAIPEASTILI